MKADTRPPEPGNVEVEKYDVPKADKPLAALAFYANREDSDGSLPHLGPAVLVPKRVLRRALHRVAQHNLRARKAYNRRTALRRLNRAYVRALDHNMEMIRTRAQMATFYGKAITYMREIKCPRSYALLFWVALDNLALTIAIGFMLAEVARRV